MAVVTQTQQQSITYPKIPAASTAPRSLGSTHETTLLDLLERAAQRYPRNGISYHASGSDVGTHDSYASLLSRARANADILIRDNIVHEQKPVLLAFDNYRESVIWYWSVLAAGGIPALLPPRRGTRESWIKELQHIGALLQFPTTLSDRSSLDYLLSAGGFVLTCTDDIPVEELGHGFVSGFQKQAQDPAADDKLDQICTILFTSGSTGPSKAVRFSHGQLLVASRLKREANNINHNDQFLCWISFDHSVALCELHLHAMDAGANLLVLPGSAFTQDPMLFWRVLSDNKVAYTFAPNSFLAAATRAYEDSAKRTHDGDMSFDFHRLKTLFCGGEANKTSTLAAAAGLLSKFGAPANAVTAVYGLSETCSALYYNRAGPSYDVSQGNAFASVGVPLPHHQLRLMDQFNQPIFASDTKGAVQLRGPTIFKGYFNNTEATKAAMTDDGWFDTGDLGSLDRLGNLRISGRTKDVLILNGQNFSCGELEYAIENCSLTGLEPGYTLSFSIWPENGDTEEVVIIFNPVHDSFDNLPDLENTIRGIADEVVRFCKKRPHMVIPLPRSYLPRSSIGKLSRAKLRSQFLAGEFKKFEHYQHNTVHVGPSFPEPRQAAIAGIFSEHLGIPYASLSADMPIESLGIDSLGYLKLLSGLERTFSLARALSVQDLVACNTIRKMDAMISEHTEGKHTVTYRPLEVLRSTGSKTPLILCHTGNGGFLNYLALWPMIPDRKIFALHAPSLETQHGAFASLTHMVDTYVEAIKSQQPQGPYAFLGFCFGGVLAFELAKRFEAMGDSVVFCGGLDSPPDVSIMRDARFSEDSIGERHHLMSILISVDMVSRDDVPMFLEKLATVPQDRVLKEAVSMLTPGALDKAGLSESKLQSWVTMSADIYRIAVDYLPSGSVRTFDAFYATCPPIGTDIPDAARWRSVYVAEWKSYVVNATNRDICFDYDERSPSERAGRPLRLHCIQGSHETVTTPEHVCALGTRVNDMLLLREDEWQQGVLGNVA
ncbi:AMP-binding enzyme domain-containing protein [Sarocladium implicatum]|nr:AMP-binding enzyme domain-containing protein [Sarocladium implicatum]